MKRLIILITILTLTTFLSGCFSRTTAVCPSIPSTFITPQPFDKLQGNYILIPKECRLYAEDAISCTYKRLQDAEHMSAAKSIDKKLRN